MKDISIIIINWNTRQLLKDCIESIIAGTRRIDYEIIVVDNASEDGSASMIESDYPSVRLLKNKENRGFAAANNQAIAISDARYCLLLNSDTVVLEDALDKTVEFADSRPEAGIIGCRVLNPDNSLQYSCSMLPSLTNYLIFLSYLYKIFPSSRIWGREKMTWWNYDTIRRVDVVNGCFMLARRSAIEQVGPLDEGYFMYVEEVDWCLRFRENGWKCLFYPDASIIHYGGASAYRHSSRRALMKDRSTVRFMFKHWPRWKAYIGLGMKMAFYASRLGPATVKLAIKRSPQAKALLMNHITGLGGLMRFSKYTEMPGK